MLLKKKISMIWIIGILAVILLIFLSAFFAGAEMAFVSLDRIRLREKAEKGNKNAELLEKLLENADEVISAIVVGNNLVNITASILAGAIATHVFGSIGIGIATAVMSMLIIIFGEATPKSFGINNEDFALKIAKYLAIIRKIFYPIAKAFTIISNYLVKLAGSKRIKSDIVTEDEIKVMLDLGVKHGTIKEDEKEMVEEIFDFDETKAIEVYVPRNKMICLKENDTVEKLIEKSIKTGYSRFPVYRKNVDDIVGMVHVKDALMKSKTTLIRNIMRSILKIKPGMKIDDVLREMQKRKIHMAIIKSKDGKTMGLVTLEDLIEEIFGEIKDEHDIR